MSRIGKAPITVPKGVTVDLKGNDVKVKGPKGELSRTIRPEIAIKMEDDKVVLSTIKDDRISRSLHGLSRTLVANMVKGVSDGFDKVLEMTGVG